MAPSISHQSTHGASAHPPTRGGGHERLVLNVYPKALGWALFADSPKLPIGWLWVSSSGRQLVSERVDNETRRLASVESLPPDCYNLDYLQLLKASSSNSQGMVSSQPLGIAIEAIIAALLHLDEMDPPRPDRFAGLRDYKDLRRGCVEGLTPEEVNHLAVNDARKAPLQSLSVKAWILPTHPSSNESGQPQQNGLT